MSEEMKEFHFGIQATRVVDVMVTAKDATEAQDKFMAASSTPDGLMAYPQAILDWDVEVLGMIEGQLPTPPSGKAPVYTVPAGAPASAVH